MFNKQSTEPSLFDKLAFRFFGEIGHLEIHNSNSITLYEYTDLSTSEIKVSESFTRHLYKSLEFEVSAK